MVKAVHNKTSANRQNLSASFPLGAVVILLAVTILNVLRGPTLDGRRMYGDSWYNTTMGAMKALNDGMSSLWASNNSHHDEFEFRTFTSPQETIPLPELVRVDETDIQCPPDMSPVPQQSNPMADRNDLDRKIPKIIHMTGKTKCLTGPFLNVAKLWIWEGHSFYFHDDEAVGRLLYERDWPLFPQLKNTMECLKGAGGAAKADLWRYLALWEYGGIYTDMDNIPGPLFNATTIGPDVDAFFLQEQGGFPSQYFFAVSPKHPMMFLAVHDVMNNLHTASDTGKFYVPFMTGPGAIKRSMMQFMGYNSSWTDEMANKYGYPTQGLYVGKVQGNRSVTIEGSRGTSNSWVNRGGVRGKDKGEGWRRMNVTNYQEVNKAQSGRSCIQYLYDRYSSEQAVKQVQDTLHHRRW